MPNHSSTSGLLPARPAPRRVACSAALLLACWMAATPASAQEDAGGGASEAAGYEAGKDDEGDGPRRGAKRRGRDKGRGDFDPKVFEERGRELQDEYYEIATLAKAPTWSAEPADLTAGPEEPRETPRGRNWILWGGVAGAAASVAVLAGWLLLEQPGNAEPVSVHLDDEP